MLVIAVTPNKYCRSPEEVTPDFPLGESSDNHLFIDITSRHPQPSEWWYYDKDTDKFYPPEDAPKDMQFTEWDLAWDNFRNQRNVMLATSDWTQLPDVPKRTRKKWKSYRQLLRDLPQAYMHIHPADIEIPYPPDRVPKVKIGLYNFYYLILRFLKIVWKR